MLGAGHPTSVARADNPGITAARPAAQAPRTGGPSASGQQTHGSEVVPADAPWIPLRIKSPWPDLTANLKALPTQRLADVAVVACQQLGLPCGQAPEVELSVYGPDLRELPLDTLVGAVAGASALDGPVRCSRAGNYLKLHLLPYMVLWERYWKGEAAAAAMLPGSAQVGGAVDRPGAGAVAPVAGQTDGGDAPAAASRAVTSAPAHGQVVVELADEPDWLPLYWHLWMSDADHTIGMPAAPPDGCPPVSFVHDAETPLAVSLDVFAAWMGIPAFSLQAAAPAEQALTELPAVKQLPDVAGADLPCNRGSGTSATARIIAKDRPYDDDHVRTEEAGQIDGRAVISLGGKRSADGQQIQAPSSRKSAPLEKQHHHPGHQLHNQQAHRQHTEPAPPAPPSGCGSWCRHMEWLRGGGTRMLRLLTAATSAPSANSSDGGSCSTGGGSAHSSTGSGTASGARSAHSSDSGGHSGRRVSNDSIDDKVCHDTMAVSRPTLDVSGKGSCSGSAGVLDVANGATSVLGLAAPGSGIAEGGDAARQGLALLWLNRHVSYDASPADLGMCDQSVVALLNLCDRPDCAACMTTRGSLYGNVECIEQALAAGGLGPVEEQPDGGEPGAPGGAGARGTGVGAVALAMSHSGGRAGARPPMLMPLGMAAANGHEDALRLLLERRVDDPNVCDKFGLPALWFAVEHGQPGCVRLLLQAGARAADWVFATPAVAAAAQGAPAAVAAERAAAERAAAAAAAGLPPAVASYMCLCHAVEVGDVRSVRELLRYGACPYTPDDSNGTPYHMAIERGDVEVLEALLDGDPAFEELQRAQSDVYRRLLHASQRVERSEVAGCPCVQCNYRVAIRAAASPETEELRAQLQLVALPVVMDAAPPESAVPLMQLMRARGALLDAHDSDGYTALHLAVRSGNLDAIRWLLQQGADPLERDSLGYMPLHLLAHYGCSAAPAATAAAATAAAAALPAAGAKGTGGATAAVAAAGSAAAAAAAGAGTSGAQLELAAARLLVEDARMPLGAKTTCFAYEADVRAEEKKLKAAPPGGLAAAAAASRGGRRGAGGASGTAASKKRSRDPMLTVPLYGGHTPAQLALRYGRPLLLAYLLHRGAPMDLSSATSRHCLEKALEAGHSAAARILLSYVQQGRPSAAPSGAAALPAAGGAAGGAPQEGRKASRAAKRSGSGGSSGKATPRDGSTSSPPAGKVATAAAPPPPQTGQTASAIAAPAAAAGDAESEVAEQPDQLAGVHTQLGTAPAGAEEATGRPPVSSLEATDADKPATAPSPMPAAGVSNSAEAAAASTAAAVASGIAPQGAVAVAGEPTSALLLERRKARRTGVVGGNGCAAVGGPAKGGSGASAANGGEATAGEIGSAEGPASVVQTVQAHAATVAAPASQSQPEPVAGSAETQPTMSQPQQPALAPVASLEATPADTQPPAPDASAPAPAGPVLASTTQQPCASSQRPAEPATCKADSAANAGATTDDGLDDTGGSKGSRSSRRRAARREARGKVAPPAPPPANATAAAATADTSPAEVAGRQGNVAGAEATDVGTGKSAAMSTPPKAPKALTSAPAIQADPKPGASATAAEASAGGSSAAAAAQTPSTGKAKGDAVPSVASAAPPPSAWHGVARGAESAAAAAAPSAADALAYTAHSDEEEDDEALMRAIAESLKHDDGGDWQVVTGNRHRRGPGHSGATGSESPPSQRQASIAAAVPAAAAMAAVHVAGKAAVRPQGTSRPTSPHRRPGGSGSNSVGSSDIGSPRDWPPLVPASAPAATPPAAERAKPAAPVPIPPASAQAPASALSVQPPVTTAVAPLPSASGSSVGAAPNAVTPAAGGSPLPAGPRTAAMRRVSSSTSAGTNAGSGGVGGESCGYIEVPRSLLYGKRGSTGQSPTAAAAAAGTASASASGQVPSAAWPSAGAGGAAALSSSAPAAAATFGGRGLAAPPAGSATAATASANAAPLAPAAPAGPGTAPAGPASTHHAHSSFAAAVRGEPVSVQPPAHPPPAAAHVPVQGGKHAAPAPPGAASQPRQPTPQQPPQHAPAGGSAVATAAARGRGGKAALAAIDKAAVAPPAASVSAKEAISGSGSSGSASVGSGVPSGKISTPLLPSSVSKLNPQAHEFVPFRSASAGSGRPAAAVGVPSAAAVHLTVPSLQLTPPGTSRTRNGLGVTGAQRGPYDRPGPNAAATPAPYAAVASGLLSPASSMTPTPGSRQGPASPTRREGHVPYGMYGAGGDHQQCTTPVRGGAGARPSHMQSQHQQPPASPVAQVMSWQAVQPIQMLSSPIRRLPDLPDLYRAMVSPYRSYVAHSPQHPATNAAGAAAAAAAAAASAAVSACAAAGAAAAAAAEAQAAAAAAAGQRPRSHSGPQPRVSVNGSGAPSGHSSGGGAAPPQDEAHFEAAPPYNPLAAPLPHLSMLPHGLYCGEQLIRPTCTRLWGLDPLQQLRATQTSLEATIAAAFGVPCYLAATSMPPPSMACYGDQYAPAAPQLGSDGFEGPMFSMGGGGGFGTGMGSSGDVDAESADGGFPRGRMSSGGGMIGGFSSGIVRALHSIFAEEEAEDGEESGAAADQGSAVIAGQITSSGSGVVQEAPATAADSVPASAHQSAPPSARSSPESTGSQPAAGRGNGRGAPQQQQYGPGLQRPRSRGPSPTPLGQQPGRPQQPPQPHVHQQQPQGPHAQQHHHQQVQMQHPAPQQHARQPPHMQHRPPAQHREHRVALPRAGPPPGFHMAYSHDWRNAVVRLFTGACTPSAPAAAQPAVAAAALWWTAVRQAPEPQPPHGDDALPPAGPNGPNGNSRRGSNGSWHGKGRRGSSGGSGAGSSGGGGGMGPGSHTHHVALPGPTGGPAHGVVVMTQRVQVVGPMDADSMINACLQGRLAPHTEVCGTLAGLVGPPPLELFEPLGSLLAAVQGGGGCYLLVEGW